MLKNESEHRLTGWLENSEHVLPIRIYYEDTDAAGIVYYSNYLKYAERARTEMIRFLGIENRQLMSEKGLAFVVRRCLTEYLQPAYLDDEVTVCTRIKEVRGASFTAIQKIIRNIGESDETLLVNLEIYLACINKNQRPVRMPADISNAVNALQQA